MAQIRSFKFQHRKPLTLKRRAGGSISPPVVFQKLSFLRAYSSSLLRAIIALNHQPFFKIFSNAVHFRQIFQILCPFLPPFFLPLFRKITRMALLSRIGPVSRDRVNPYFFVTVIISHIFLESFIKIP